MSNEALKMVKVKYYIKNELILRNIFLSIPKKESFGIVSNDKLEINALKKILISPKTNYCGFIFCNNNLLSKNKKAKEANFLENYAFDILDFQPFHDKQVLEMFNEQLFSTTKIETMQKLVKSNWEDAFIHNDKDKLDKEMEIYIKLFENQIKLIKNFGKKWSSKIKKVTLEFQIKEYKDFFSFLKVYDIERHDLYSEMLSLFIKAQNEVINIYLNSNCPIKVALLQEKQQEKLSDLFADGNTEIIEELQNEVTSLQQQINDTTILLERLKEENRILWTTVFFDLNNEINNCQKALKNNNAEIHKKIFWYKKFSVLKIQFAKLKKFKKNIDHLTPEQFQNLLQDLELHNDNIIVESFHPLVFNKKSKKEIALDIKRLDAFSFYNYELQSQDNRKETKIKIRQLQNSKLELEKKLANKSLYNQKQLNRQFEENILIKAQNIADKKWEHQTRKTELTTMVVNIQKNKNTLIESYQQNSNWLFNIDKKILSLVNRLDLIFSFFSKKDKRKIENRKYRTNFRKYLEQDQSFVHLKKINHFFENGNIDLILKKALVLYNISKVLEQLGLNFDLLWNRYKNLDKDNKLKINLVLSSFLEKKFFILDFENNQVTPEIENLCLSFFTNKNVLVFDKIKKLKKMGVKNIALVARGYIVEQAPSREFFNKPHHPFLKDFLKTQNWDSEKLQELEEMEFMSFNSRKIYHQVAPQHWVFSSANYLDAFNKTKEKE